MLSKNVVFALTVPLTFATAYAKIPTQFSYSKHVESNDLRYVLKDISPSDSKTPEDWFNLSPGEGAEGVRTNETYVNFGIPQSDDIIVAVIDSGVDVNHEDLDGKIWINEKEVVGNGIDDDQNGYVDDIYGWNFIGGSKGMATFIENDSKNGYFLQQGDMALQVGHEQLEVTRELARMYKLRDAGTITPKQTIYMEALEPYIVRGYSEAKNFHKFYKVRIERFNKSAAVLKAAGLTEYSLETLAAFIPSNEAEVGARNDLLKLLSVGHDLQTLTDVFNQLDAELNYQYNVFYNARSIVGDNPEDMSERYYGNNNVIGPDAGHGTHVAGSIAANRDNGIGINGIASNVKIMAIRVVPDGDERDKDVANGIRYAVDNGAKIINMSFGKSLSPNKSAVDEAVKYAESKGVLLVHAAGNENKDVDQFPTHPMKTLNDGTQVRNWIEVCATSFEKSNKLIADFSNFGKKTVDICAPGVDVYSTIPGNKYAAFSGTSMASPTVAGVAALILSYKESLSAVELRDIILSTARKYDELEVTSPANFSQIKFSELSVTGGVADVFEAVKSVR